MLNSQKILLLAILCEATFGAPFESPYEQKDLATFVTRPDIRPPKFDVNVYDADAVSPGYWFVSTYVDLKSRVPSSAWSPDQIGPHIYDGRGNLVYSGASLVDGRTTFDFKAVDVKGSQHLSLIVDHDNGKPRYKSGAGLLINSNFEIESTIENKVGNRVMNMHEFNIVEKGASALTITYNPELFDFGESSDGEGPYGNIGNNGFQDMDLSTGKINFEWWALDHVDWTESYENNPHAKGGGIGTWDWFHMNSVDKNAEGDYLISGRFTNAIYKISGKDGSIIWRLGGKKSSFKQDGFHFSAQHDARFQYENDTTTVISFLNNASNGRIKTANTSSVMEIALNKESMTASLLNDFPRPDGELTKLRGNAQKLPNDNYFICWSENGHISEHDPKQNKVVMEAQFSSKRFVTYRGGKFNFTGRPTWPPVAKAFAYGVTPVTSTTTIYVSWNGATEVDEWQFWGSQHENPRTDFDKLGKITKDGFEDIFMTKGFVPYVFAEAISSNGESLGYTDITKVQTPTDKWTSSQIVENSEQYNQYQRSETDSSDSDNRSNESHKNELLANLRAKLMESKRLPAIAIYLWLLSIAGIIVWQISRSLRRMRRQPWMRTELENAYIK